GAGFTLVQPVGQFFLFVGQLRGLSQRVVHLAQYFLLPRRTQVVPLLLQFLHHRLQRFAGLLAVGFRLISILLLRFVGRLLHFLGGLLGFFGLIFVLVLLFSLLIVGLVLGGSRIVLLRLIGCRLLPHFLLEFHLLLRLLDLLLQLIQPRGETISLFGHILF